MRRALLYFALAAGLPLAAQYPGGYPQGGPSGSGGNGLPFPWPSRGKQDKSGKNTPQDALEKFSGTLRSVDDKLLVVEAADGRVLSFQRIEKTKFYKGPEEIKASDFEPGCQVSVEAAEDQKGYLSAINVYLDRAVAGGNAPANAPDYASAPAPTQTAPPSAPRDADDPGPPTLAHGIPPKRQATATSEPSAAPVPPPDPLIEKARAAAESFSEQLPNYICKEYIARFASTTRPVDWEPLDVVSAEVVYEDGRESYRHVAINNKPVNKEMQQIEGAWSIGEFGTALRELLSPATAADFHLSRESLVSGAEARVYNFEVTRLYSRWRVQAASQSIVPAYKGSVWIDPKSGRVLRIEMQARQIPEGFPLDTVESAVDYEYVRIGEGQFLLPVHAENLSCQRGTNNCTHNTLDFRNYHKYEAGTSITFDETNTR